jgi:hypothetical protein
MEQEKLHPYKVGENYLIRTVTMIYTGKLLEVFPQELVISKACWIPETERWNESVLNATFKEQEPYPADKEVIIGRGAILDCVEITSLPTEVK